jgi:NAD(P)-dependent dehydrogenase (short-subunit alcohol dehydrogenase family)
MTQEEIAVVTGSSTGIGFETSLTLARNGFHTYATIRMLEGSRGSEQIIDIAKRENLPLQVIQLDVDNDKSVSMKILGLLFHKLAHPNWRRLSLIYLILTLSFIMTN